MKLTSSKVIKIVGLVITLSKSRGHIFYSRMLCKYVRRGFQIVMLFCCPFECLPDIQS